MRNGYAGLGEEQAHINKYLNEVILNCIKTHFSVNGCDWNEFVSRSRTIIYIILSFIKQILPQI